MSQAGAVQADGWRQRIGGAVDFVRRRMAGDYEVDESGFDPELTAAMLMPLFRPFYTTWFRVQMRGVENVPASGAALVVANHSGVLPLDAIMLQIGIFDEHPQHRNLRLLSANLVYEVPVLSTMARRSGHVRADRAEAERQLAAGELLGVFPEGFKGIGKPFRQRYQLQRFGRGGFAHIARQAGVPIIPCAIVGAEEIYPMIGNWSQVARLLGLPYFPVTPLFPWLGAIGATPLPSNWIIEFCPPVPTDDSGFGRASASLAGADESVSCLADTVRDTIQRKLDELVVERGPAFSY
ncbi:MAG TPA: lysophospholipid acyltransferase family protein [Streptosporangiaceae bacterium]|nr:lysophospholipid acyltransferase family protein [Streptosporangiaceae bacterium]